jgi:hypothetical protein
MYRTASTTLMGEALVRFSKSGDFQLMFSKGPGLPLLTLRQDSIFAEIEGPLARNGWSGPINHAPKQLRGWLGLRDAIMGSLDRHVVHHVAGDEHFLLRF